MPIIVFNINHDKTDCHDITEILLKVALNTIKQTKSDRDQILYDYKIYCSMINVFRYIKVLIKSCKSKKDMQYYGQQKEVQKTNNGSQNATQH